MTRFPTREMMYLLWVVPIVFQFIIGLSMALKRLHKEFPYFFTYTVFQVLKECVLLFVHFEKGYAFFFSAYWTAEFVSGILGLLVIQEIFNRVFRPYAALQRLGRLLFYWSFAMLIFLAIITVIFAPGRDPQKFMAGILVLERSLRVVQLGLLFFLSLFVSCFGLSWKHYIFGIGLGFGLYAAADLAVLALRTGLGRSASDVLNLARSLAYNCAVLTWVSYFLVPERQVKRAVYSVPSTRLEEWNSALLHVLTR